MSEEDTMVSFVWLPSSFWLRRHKIVMNVGSKSVVLVRCWSRKKAVDKVNWWNQVAREVGA